MRTISREQVVKRLKAENPWWDARRTASLPAREWKPRAYFDLFMPLVTRTEIRRAVVLMGPRRVGKTVMIHHSIQRLIADGIPPRSICYFSVDHPIYNGLGLEELLEFFRDATGTDYATEPSFVFFDEVQYLRDWEIHLKSLVDTYSPLKLVASGSAAAALRLKSGESGAGRFTDFLLPPLTFYEYLDLLGEADRVKVEAGEMRTDDIQGLNARFMDYLNFGGYPEVVFSKEIQADPGRFIKNDIIDKVLLRDLPGLYGIRDIQELNYLFTTLAFNTANEISLDELAKRSGVAKNTIKRYIEYLEAAFLIRVVHRVDRSAKRFHRANFFKVYLTNPSMRAALFSPISADDEMIGALAETAIFAQWFHSNQALHYARWQGGEVDIVLLGQKQKPELAVEVKWSDQYARKPGDLRSLLAFCEANGLTDATVTSRTKSAHTNVRGVDLTFIPASIYCYLIGARNIAVRWLDAELSARVTIDNATSED
ncbi:ATP-binding protein [Longimicrobium sp.]|uniref:ATP-binding protein n=1 Tax=Longimicrobium sp. TaxID=2029185 RepID=UPI003B3BCA52